MKFENYNGAVDMACGRKRRPFMQFLPAILLAVLMLNVIATVCPATCHGRTSPEEEAYEKSRDEFKAVHGSVSETRDSLEKAKKVMAAAVGEVEERISQMRRDGKTVPKDVKQAVARLKSAQKSLEGAHELLANFGDYSEKITAATDVYDEIVELRKKMDADRNSMGNLAAELRALGKIMEKGGEHVPLLGDAIKAYGTVTTGLVDKLGEVATTIDSNRNQDQLGHGTYDTNEKNRAFRDFQRSHPKELLADVYYRSVPSYLYEPAGGTREGNSVIWDEDSRGFTIVPRDVPARDIFKMSLLIDKRLSASELEAHMVEWKKGGERRLEISLALQSLLNSLRKGSAKSVVSKVSQENDDELYILLRNPRMFDARYVYDRKVHNRLHDNLREIYDGLMAEGGKESSAQAEQIRRFARKHKLNIAFSEPKSDEAEKKEKKAEKKEKKGNSFLENLIKAIAEPAKTESTGSQKSAVPQQQTSKEESARPVQKKPAASRPAMKPGGVAKTCGECAQSGLDCACGKAACRCCAPGDSNCNAFDL